MQQVKMFEKTNAAALEKSVNTWLTEMGDNINITQRLMGYSIHTGTVQIAIFYIKK